MIDTPTQMNNTKRQHIIPRMHLKHFVGSNPQGHIWTYDKPRGSNPRSSPPENTGLMKEFYSFKDDEGLTRRDFESALSLVKGDAAPIYEELLLNDQIPCDES